MNNKPSKTMLSRSAKFITTVLNLVSKTPDHASYLITNDW